MPLDHLWATWRSDYVTGLNSSRSGAEASDAGDGPTGIEGSTGVEGSTGAPDPDAGPPIPDVEGLSLFERILAAPGTDDEKQIVLRGERCFVILNRFPYTSGHLMVLPLRAVPNLDDLDAEEFAEIWALVRDAVVALKAGLACDAVNVGINLGIAAGGSQADHLHVHCVPRWVGDANFMSVAGETRVLPVSLDHARDAIRAAWPAS